MIETLAELEQYIKKNFKDLMTLGNIDGGEELILKLNITELIKAFPNLQIDLDTINGKTYIVMGTNKVVKGRDNRLETDTSLLDDQVDWSNADNSFWSS